MKIRIGDLVVDNLSFLRGGIDNVGCSYYKEFQLLGMELTKGGEFFDRLSERRNDVVEDVVAIPKNDFFELCCEFFSEFYSDIARCLGWNPSFEDSGYQFHIGGYLMLGDFNEISWRFEKYDNQFLNSVLYDGLNFLDIGFENYDVDFRSLNNLVSIQEKIILGDVLHVL